MTRMFFFFLCLDAPRCSNSVAVVTGVSKHETAPLSCHIDADPPDVHFWWTFLGTPMKSKPFFSTIKPIAMLSTRNCRASMTKHYCNHNMIIQLRIQYDWYNLFRNFADGICLLIANQLSRWVWFNSIILLTIMLHHSIDKLE